MRDEAWQWEAGAGRGKLKGEIFKSCGVAGSGDGERGNAFK